MDKHCCMPWSDHPLPEDELTEALARIEALEAKRQTLLDALIHINVRAARGDITPEWVVAVSGAAIERDEVQDTHSRQPKVT